MQFQLYSTGQVEHGKSECVADTFGKRLPPKPSLSAPVKWCGLLLSRETLQNELLKQRLSESGNWKSRVRTWIWRTLLLAHRPLCSYMASLGIHKYRLLYQFLLCGGTNPTPRVPPNADAHLRLISPRRPWELGGKDHRVWILQGHNSL